MTNQRVVITTLAALPEASVDMQTTLFVGNSTTMVYCDFMITPRGYSDKYEISGPRPRTEVDREG